MTATAAPNAPIEGATGDAALGSWDERVRAALVDGRELTHAGVSVMAEDDLVALGAALGAVRKDADRMMAVVAAEQAARSRAKAGDVGVARRRGKGDERGIVAGQTGGSSAEAGRLIELGEALRDAERADGADPSPQPPSPPGEDAPEPAPVFPAVAKAVNAGELGVEGSAMILRMLRRVAQRCSDHAVAKAEKDLVYSARYMQLNRLAGLITRTEERLDRQHLEELAASRRERRFLRIGEAQDGMITINGRLDPENGAPLVAVMHAMVGQNFRLRKRMKDAAKAGESVVIDERTPEQVRADAMGDFARHLAGCEVEVLPRAGVTLVVRTSLTELREGMGGASVDGLATSMEPGALRRAAAGAGVIPQVMGGGSVVLDQGRRKRPFTFEQKLALAERDGGCAMCGAPPSWCDAHHIQHWSRGGVTDMSNGVLLCVRCHHDVHRDNWEIHASADQVWFTPPVAVDPARRRRPGGRRLFDASPLEPEPPPQTGAGLDFEADGRCALAAPAPCLVIAVPGLGSEGGSGERASGEGGPGERARRAARGGSRVRERQPLPASKEREAGRSSCVAPHPTGRGALPRRRTLVSMRAPPARALQAGPARELGLGARVGRALVHGLNDRSGTHAQHRQRPNDGRSQ